MRTHLFVLPAVLLLLSGCSAESTAPVAPGRRAAAGGLQPQAICSQTNISIRNDTGYVVHVRLPLYDKERDVPPGATWRPIIDYAPAVKIKVTYKAFSKAETFTATNCAVRVGIRRVSPGILDLIAL